MKVESVRGYTLALKGIFNHSGLETLGKEAKGDDVVAFEEGPNLYKSFCLNSLSFTPLFSYIIVHSFSYIYSLYCHFPKCIYCEFYLRRIWSLSNSPLLGLFIYTWANTKKQHKSWIKITTPKACKTSNNKGKKIRICSKRICWTYYFKKSLFEPIAPKVVQIPWKLIMESC